MDHKKIIKQIQARARIQQHRAMRELVQEELASSSAGSSSFNVNESESGIMTESRDESDLNARNYESECDFDKYQTETESDIEGNRTIVSDILQYPEDRDNTGHQHQYPDNENEANLSDNDDMEQEIVIQEGDEEVQQIREWAVECQIQQNHLDGLLRILSQRLLPTLPTTAKTFLSTSSAVYVIKEMAAEGHSPGEFVYLTIKKGLEDCIDPTVHINGTIYLQINVDGIPLFSSSNVNFWPILGKVHYSPHMYKPFPIAVFCGNSKPKSVDDYLKEFIAEINELQQDGLVINDKKFNVAIKCFICATPARSFLKCTKGHGGYAACERCEIIGIRYKNR